MMNLKEHWVDNASILIIDDFPTDDKHPAPSWVKMALGGQRRFTVTDKYCRKKTVTGPFTTIWLGNHLPNFGFFSQYANDHFKWVNLEHIGVDRLCSRIIKPRERE